jgi:hypothetical protein
MVWELDDPQVKGKIQRFARDPELVYWSGTAERDLAGTSGATKAGVLDGILDHISCGFPIMADYMKNGDLAFIFDCFVGIGRLYVKVKMITVGTEERMFVFSAHKHK